jgi:hypothetical protein
MAGKKAAADMTVAELLAWQADIVGMATLVKEDASALQAELDRRFGVQHKADLAKADKTAGTATSVLPNASGIRLKADTPKGKVEWDQAKLWGLAADLTREQLEHYCRIELTPKEAVYKALPPDNNMKGALKDARTDGAPGKTKYVLLAEGEK